MKCFNCGFSISDNEALFCPACGKRLTVPSHGAVKSSAETNNDDMVNRIQNALDGIVSYEDSMRQESCGNHASASPMREPVPGRGASVPPPVREPVPGRGAPVPPPVREPMPGRGAPVPPPVREPVPGRGAPVPPPVREPVPGRGAPVPPPVREPMPGRGAPVPPPVREPVSGRGAPVPPPVREPMPGRGAPVPPPVRGSIPQRGAPVPPPARNPMPGRGAPVPPPVRESAPQRDALMRAYGRMPEINTDMPVYQQDIPSEHSPEYNSSPSELHKTDKKKKPQQIRYGIGISDEREEPASEGNIKSALTAFGVGVGIAAVLSAVIAVPVALFIIF